MGDFNALWYLSPPSEIIGNEVADQISKSNMVPSIKTNQQDITIAQQLSMINTNKWSTIIELCSKTDPSSSSSNAQKLT